MRNSTLCPTCGEAAHSAACAPRTPAARYSHETADEALTAQIAEARGDTCTAAPVGSFAARQQVDRRKHDEGLAWCLSMQRRADDRERALRG